MFIPLVGQLIYVKPTPIIERVEAFDRNTGFPVIETIEKIDRSYSSTIFRVLAKDSTIIIAKAVHSSSCFGILSKEPQMFWLDGRVTFELVGPDVAKFFKLEILAID